MPRRGARKYSPFNKKELREATAVAQHQGVVRLAFPRPLRQPPEGLATGVASPSFPLW
jgi:hypothetical protein